MRYKFMYGSLLLIVVTVGTILYNALGLSVYRINSRSMEPILSVGTLVVDSSRVPLMPYSAVTFVAEGRPVTHVLGGFNRDGSLITRGLANRSDDSWLEPVHPQDVKGSVIAVIPFFTKSYWHSHAELMLLFGVATAACIGLYWVSRIRI